MKSLELNAYGVSEINCEESIDIYGGGIAKDIGKAIGEVVGYVAGCVKDAITEHGQTVADSGGAASVVAYK